MTTSNQFAFNPPLSDIIVNAFGRISIKPTEILAQHLRNGYLEANLLQAEFSNRAGPNLWTVQLFQTPLVQGTATYNLPSTMVQALDIYVTTTAGTYSYDRILSPLGRSDYAAIPNKTIQAPPTSCWIDKLVVPTATLWPVPDGSATYTLNIYINTQIQDAVIGNATSLQLVWRFMDAFTAGLAARLARIYAQPLLQEAKMEAERAWMLAATQDSENVPWGIFPALGGYFSRQ